jgi:hypothetical protein
MTNNLYIVQSFKFPQATQTSAFIEERDTMSIAPSRLLENNIYTTEEADRSIYIFTEL